MDDLEATDAAYLEMEEAGVTRFILVAETFDYYATMLVWNERAATIESYILGGDGLTGLEPLVTGVGPVLWCSFYGAWHMGLHAQASHDPKPSAASVNSRVNAIINDLTKPTSLKGESND